MSNELPPDDNNPELPEDNIENSSENNDNNSNASSSNAASNGSFGGNPGDPGQQELIPGPNALANFNDGTNLIRNSIDEELSQSYLTYSMSVIISRALPDVRDGLKPSQRRILVAMNDLNLGPQSSRVKCAKISGDTSGNYHPHGESIIYPTLVRMAQDWVMRYVLIDKQGNFGSIAGLPAAAMRYTEARMSRFASLMLEDINLGTVDFVPTYDERNLEPTVLPARFPNLLVNGVNGIAVGMATSIPPHNMGEICDCVVKIIDDPGVSIDELLEICPGPDFPTGSTICGRSGIRRGYHTGRGTVLLRATAKIEEMKNNRSRILISDIPYQQTRDNVEERIADMVNEGKIEGISNIRNESDLKEPVRLILELKRDADPDVVLNQLYQYTPLQSTFSLNFVALVDGKPRTLSFKEMLEEFLRHRMTVIRRRTQFLLDRAKQRKHTVEGLLLAHANIDQVIRVIRTSTTQQEAKQRLMVEIECPRALIERALGDDAFQAFAEDHGVNDNYTLTPVQADAILRMTLGQLVNLEQEKLVNEFKDLIANIREYKRILSDDMNILKIVRDDILDIKRRFADPRRTEISGQDVGDIDLEDLSEEETMVVSISSNGYIKRTPADEYKAQRRGGKGIKGAKAEGEDPIQHLFVASTHAYLMFFTNLGKCYWKKIYDLPQAARDARGRAVINLVQLDPGEVIADCLAVRDYDLPDHHLVFATANGLVKKTNLSAYKRPWKAGLKAIKMREGDELVDVVVTGPGDQVVLSTANGMAIRFPIAVVRAAGRDSSGVKGINLSAGDRVVGMVVADPNASLLTVCEHGYGKRTPFGPGSVLNVEAADVKDENAPEVDAPEADTPEAGVQEADVPEVEAPEADVPETDDADSAEASDSSDSSSTSSTRSYRTQNRGGKGLRDIRTTERNGKVIGIVRVYNGDEVLMMTAHGKLQRIGLQDMRDMGRNTQGVRMMNLDKGDLLVAVKRIPRDETADTVETSVIAETPVTAETPVSDVNEPTIDTDNE